MSPESYFVSPGEFSTDSDPAAETMRITIRQGTAAGGLRISGQVWGVDGMYAGVLTTVLELNAAMPGRRSFDPSDVLNNVDYSNDLLAAAYYRPMATIFPDGLAILPIHGILTKDEGFSTSTRDIVEQVKRLASADSVRGILVFIDSPGGTVAGTNETADAIAAAASRKPVWTYAETCLACAYWCIARTGRIIAGPSSIIGSIGTYIVAADASKAAEMQGVKVHIVRAGELKGGDAWGTKPSDKYLAHKRELVDGINREFFTAVATGRRLTPERLKPLTEGRSYVGRSAVAAGLADELGTLDTSVKRLRNAFR